jgi:hypothetical protein
MSVTPTYSMKILENRKEGVGLICMFSPCGAVCSSSYQCRIKGYLSSSAIISDLQRGHGTNSLYNSILSLFTLMYLSFILRGFFFQNHLFSNAWIRGLILPEKSTKPFSPTVSFEKKKHKEGGGEELRFELVAPCPF